MIPFAKNRFFTEDVEFLINNHFKAYLSPGKLDSDRFLHHLNIRFKMTFALEGDVIFIDSQEIEGELYYLVEFIPQEPENKSMSLLLLNKEGPY